MNQSDPRQSGAMVPQGPAVEHEYFLFEAKQSQHPETLHLQGVLKGQLGLYAEGIRLIEQAIIKSPSISSYYKDLGTLRLKIGDISGAEKSFRYAIKLDRKSADAQLNLGKLLEEKTDWFGARECFAAAVRLAPQSDEAHISLARLDAADEDALL